MMTLDCMKNHCKMYLCYLCVYNKRMSLSNVSHVSNVSKYTPDRTKQVFSGDADNMKDRGYQLIRMRSPNQSVVFFDIDDTLLNTHQYVYEGGYMRSIAPIVGLYKTCRSIGLKTVIITARPAFQENIEFTKNELLFHGLGFDLLYMRPIDDTNDVADFKKWCRCDALHRLGGEPLFAIGDRVWDFGPYGGTGLWIKD